jgi:hypothetical protein
MKRINAIRRRAEAGDAGAQAEFGWRYDRGLGVRKSYKSAFEWYLKAAHNGQRAAQYNLNLCYLHGIGTSRDDKLAFRWVQKSAAAAFPDAILAMGWHYHNGCGVTPNLRLAENWYRKSARLGDSSAQFSLGQLFFDAGNYSHAKRWFFKAVAQNHPRSNYYLGRMYLAGLGVRKDAVKAKSLLRNATRLRAPFAIRLLRSCWLKRELALQSVRKTSR